MALRPPTYLTCTLDMGVWGSASAAYSLPLRPIRCTAVVLIMKCVIHSDEAPRLRRTSHTHRQVGSVLFASLHGANFIVCVTFLSGKSPSSSVGVARA